MFWAIMAEATEDYSIGGNTLELWAEFCKHDENHMMVRGWVQIHGLTQKVDNGMPVKEAPLSQQPNRAGDVCL